jgi:hypothetical protein
LYKILKLEQVVLDDCLNLYVEKYRRYNTKSFSDYQEAKKYVRRLVTRLHGSYSDTYSQYGFTIQKV